MGKADYFRQFGFLKTLYDGVQIRQDVLGC